ncbi:MAG: S41 family peptidase [Pseudonocardiaceae bacterium]
MDADGVTCAAQALELLKREAYYSNRVDWATVAEQVLSDAHAGMPLVQAIRPALAALGDRHSHLRPANWTATLHRQHNESPHGGYLGQGVAYLCLPAISIADPRSLDSVNYARAAFGVLETYRSAHAWIVDLRGNTGGSVHPMLAAVGPLLGAVTFLSYQRRAGGGARFTYQPGRLLNNGTPTLDLPTVPQDSSGLPVAVVHDGRTASAGEGVAVAFSGRQRTRTFGSATAGVPTGNVLRRLPDGSMLAVTVSVAVDRKGRRYTSALFPEEPSDQTLTDPIHQARSWLTNAE